MLLTPGQRNDGTQLFALLDAIGIPREGGGRARKRPDRLLADRGYSKDLYRRMLRARGIPHTIPERTKDRKLRAERPGGAPFTSTRSSTPSATWSRGAWGASNSGAQWPRATRSGRSITARWY